MDRRNFLRTSFRAAVALGALRTMLDAESALPGTTVPLAPAVPLSPAPGEEPELLEYGSPYRRSADLFASSRGSTRDRERLREEMIHHRMPPAWRDRLLLGIRE